MPTLKRTAWPGTQTGLKRKKATLASTTTARPRAAAARATPQRATLAAQTTTAPPPSATPGPSAGGQATRTAATEGYRMQVADINRQLLQAALRFGGAGAAKQFNIDTGVWEDVAAPQNDPLSSTAQVERTLQENTKGLRNELTQNNTYFSGMHIDRQQELRDLADRDRTEAQRQYEDAVAQLLGLGGQARVDWTRQMSEADAADIAAATAREPTPGVQSQVPAQVQIRIPTSSKYPLMQNSGPNAGIAYQIVNKNGKRYRQYADGRPPVPA